MELRFLDAFSSEYAGRSHLLSDEVLLTTIVSVLKGEYTDNTSRKAALGIIQKLSLRRRPQELLIDLDLIKWTVNILNTERSSLSDYFSEYATALLMNLSLRSRGRQKCEEVGTKLLKVLLDLLKHPNVQVKSFVCGTLYSNLTRHGFKQQAIKMGLETVLNSLIRESPPELHKNYQYILNQLQSPSPAEDDNLSEINEDEHDADLLDDEEMGEEDEFGDGPHFEGTTRGEDLLAPFILMGKEAENVVLPLDLATKYRRGDDGRDHEHVQT